MSFAKSFVFEKNTLNFVENSRKWRKTQGTLQKLRSIDSRVEARTLCPEVVMDIDIVTIRWVLFGWSQYAVLCTASEVWHCRLSGIAAQDFDLFTHFALEFSKTQEISENSGNFVKKSRNIRKTLVVLRRTQVIL